MTGQKNFYKFSNLFELSVNATEIENKVEFPMFLILKIRFSTLFFFIGVLIYFDHIHLRQYLKQTRIGFLSYLLEIMQDDRLLLLFYKPVELGCDGFLN